MKKLLLLVAVALSGLQAFATHIIGGEMSYQYVGNNEYHFILNVYRDCINGQAPFDNPAVVTVFDANANVVMTFTGGEPIIDTIPLSMNCLGLPTTMCAEQGTYEFNLTLPPLTGGYTIAYQRCCRSGIITNLAAPLDQGMTINATIPGPGLAVNNNSPVFSNYPPTAFCVGIPIYFDHSATDADGDSLAYELTPGAAGADPTNPYPIPAFPPPYSNVNYATPFSGDYPFDAAPALAINATTGMITGTPASIGIFTLGIMVKEYRNGVLIGEHRREMAEVYTVAGMPTGISDDAVNSRAVIYPVPATNELDIIPPSIDKIKEVKIFDALGNLQFSEKINQSIQPFSISLNDFKNGTYFIQLIREFSTGSQSFLVTK